MNCFSNLKKIITSITEVQGANAINGDDITTQVEGLNIPAPDPTTEDGTTAGRIVCNNEGIVECV